MLPEPAAPGPSEIIAASRGARLRLSAMQQRFVELYARPSPINGHAFNASEAARQAGYKTLRVNRTAYRLLHNPKVKAAIDGIRAEVAERASYTVERCMTELEKGMEFALKTENASAYVRAVELRGKLTGLLVDRLDARVAVGTFAINVIGLDGGNG